MAPTTEVTITIPTLEGIAAVLAVAYYATVVAHPYIAGFLLMSWSYHPEKPIQAIRYIAGTLPKNCMTTVRGWLQSKTAPDSVYNPIAGFTTPNLSPYDTYTPIGAGGCQLGCCKPTPYYTSPYTSSYPSSPPTYGAVLPITPMASPNLNPYDTYTPPTGAGGCQLGYCNPIPYNTPSSYRSPLPTYGAVPPFTPYTYYGLEKGSELEGGERSGLWQMFGWVLWFCGLAVMTAYGPRAA